MGIDLEQIRQWVADNRDLVISVAFGVSCFISFLLGWWGGSHDE